MEASCAKVDFFFCKQTNKIIEILQLCNHNLLHKNTIFIIAVFSGFWWWFDVFDVVQLILKTCADYDAEQTNL